MATKFDLKTLQLDAVNAFVHANLHETVFIHMLPRFSKYGKVLRLNRVLYSFC